LVDDHVTSTENKYSSPIWLALATLPAISMSIKTRHSSPSWTPGPQDYQTHSDY